MNRREKEVFVGMNKDQIKEAPDHDADRHATDEHGNENWNRALVEHASENNVTLTRATCSWQSSQS